MDEHRSDVSGLDSRESMGLSPSSNKEPIRALKVKSGLKGGMVVLERVGGWAQHLSPPR